MAVHLLGNEPSIEGLLTTYRTKLNGDHYVVEIAELIVAPGRTEELDGPRVRIPREKVSWIQELV